MKNFDGKLVAAKIDDYLRLHVAAKKPNGKLLIVLIGDDVSSIKYIGVKTRLCESLGIDVRLEKISADLPDEIIFEIVKKAFLDPEVRGGIVQLPLPRKSLEKVLDFIPAHKDVDLISSTKIYRFYDGDFNNLPPVVRAFSLFLVQALSNNDLFDVHALDPGFCADLIKDKSTGLKFAVIGDGFLVGKPIAHYLTSFGIAIKHNKNYSTGEKIYSDFLILGTGHSNLVNGEDISNRCNVLDFGASAMEGKVVGDLNRNSKTNHLGLVSFSPGGIGPVVVRFLILNWLEL